MSADGTAPPQAMCPNCGAWNPWPPEGECSACRAPLAGQLVGAIWDIDRQANELQVRRRDLLARLRTEMPGPAIDLTTLPPPPPTATPSRTSRPPAGLTGLKAQTILGLAGVGLLTLAAVAFAAVTWRTLGSSARVAILVVVSLATAAVASQLTRRGLRSTGGALAGLAVVLSFVTFVTAGRRGVLGDVDAFAGPTLGFVAATVTAWTLSGRWRREADAGPRLPLLLPAAQFSWGLATFAGYGWVLSAGDVLGWAAPLAVAGGVVVLVASPVLQRSAIGDGFASAFLLVAALGAPFRMVAGTRPEAVGALVAGVLATIGWSILARGRRLPSLGSLLAASTATGLVVGSVFRLVPDDHPQWTYAAVIAAFLLLLAVEARPEIHGPGSSVRVAATVGLWPAALPGITLAAVALGDAAGGLIDQAARPWNPPGGFVDPVMRGGHDAVVLLGAVAVVMMILVINWDLRVSRQAGIATSLLVIAAPAAMWHVDAGPGVTWILALLPTAGLVLLTSGDWMPSRPDRALLVPGAALAGLGSIGWVAGSRPGTLAGAAMALVIVAALRFGPGGTSEHSSAGSVVLVAVASWAAAIAAATIGALVELDPIAAASLAAAGAAAGAVLFRRDEQHDATVVLVIGLGQLLTVGVALVANEPLAAAAAGFTAALSMFALAMRAPDPTLAAATWAAILHATLATALVLVDRDVVVVEAYTAAPAGMLVILGVARLLHDRMARSAATVLPGLAVFVVSSILALAADPAHTNRALALAVGVTFLLALGVRLRVSAPMIAGAIGVVGLVLTQLPVVAAVVPRWILFASLGLALVVLSATYEARLADVRRLAERVQAYR